MSLPEGDQAHTSTIETGQLMRSTPERRQTSELVVSLAIVFFMQVYAVGLVSLGEGWYDLQGNSVVIPLVPIWAVIWQAAGMLLMGSFSDRIGRKDAFLYAAGVSLAGSIGLVESENAYVVLAFAAVLLFGTGGATNAALTIVQEEPQLSHRTATSYMIVNSGNIGGLALASFAFYAGFDRLAFQKGQVEIMAVLALGLLAYGTYRLRESAPWLEARHSRKERESGVSVRLRYLVCVSMGLTAASGIGLTTVGVNFLTEWLGPNFFPGVAPMMSLMAYAAAFVAGLVATALAEMTGRRLLLLVTFAGASVTVLATYAAVPLWAGNVDLFWLLLVLLSTFAGVACLGLNTLMAEIWVTYRRGTMLGLVRASSFLLVAPVLVLRQGMDVYQYAALSTALWIIGFAGAAIWFVASRA
jgi:hypothetical protein